MRTLMVVLSIALLLLMFLSSNQQMIKASDISLAASNSVLNNVVKTDLPTIEANTVASFPEITNEIISKAEQIHNNSSDLSQSEQLSIISKQPVNDYIVQANADYEQAMRLAEAKATESFSSESISEKTAEIARLIKRIRGKETRN